MFGLASHRALQGLFLVACLLLAGCETLGYYSQSGIGQLALLSRRQPVDQLVAAPATEPELASQLALAQSILAYAHSDLDLPDQGSYRQFVDVGREALVWSVVAAPRFSLVPKKWCYPIIGCANYRGYFKRDAAEQYARRLEKQAWDVAVQRVPAYSTLGWFDDPIPSTVIYWPAADLAELLFHELAHQRLYIPDDSDFNESYASAVAEVGVRQWLRANTDDKALVAWGRRAQRKRVIDRLIQTARHELQLLYERDLDSAQRGREKNLIFDRLRMQYLALAAQPGYEAYRSWFAQELNNAHLVSIATYRKWVPAFRQLLIDAKGNFRCFHRQVEALGKLATAERAERLTQLVAAATSTDRDVSAPAGTAEQ